MLKLDVIIARLSHDRGWRHPSILDVAVSSGATTCDLQEVFRSSGIDPSIVATDIGIEAAILDVAPGVRVLIDASGTPLQYECFGVAIRAWNRRLDYIFGYWILTKVMQSIPIRLQTSHRKNVKLISRRINSLKMDFVEDDLAVPNPAFEKRFDIVRAANILNRGYFPEPKLRSMISNLKSYALGTGALIVINRTHLDGSNHGTVFSLSSDDTLKILERIGDGSEVEGLALDSSGVKAVPAKPLCH